MNPIYFVFDQSEFYARFCGIECALSWMEIAEVAGYSLAVFGYFLSVTFGRKPAA